MPLECRRTTSSTARSPSPFLFSICILSRPPGHTCLLLDALDLDSEGTLLRGEDKGGGGTLGRMGEEMSGEGQM